MPIHTDFFRRVILTHKVSHTDLVFGVQSGLLVSLCMQHYKSLCTAVMICSTLVNIQTHIQGQHLTSLHEKLLYEKLKQLR